MIVYLIKMVLCSGLLLGAYHLLLEKEKMHTFNRFYLLCAVIFSLIFPLISIQAGTITVPENPEPVYIDPRYYSAQEDLPAIHVETKQVINYLFIGLVIYSVITLALLFRLIDTFSRIRSKASRHKGIRYKNARLILLDERTTTHTFLNTIFVSPDDRNGEKVDEAILTHEWAHVRQKHSLDIVFIELVKAIFWFNPLFILYKRAIQLNHEFLADDAVIHRYKDVPAYQHLLLDKISQNSSSYLSSQLNFSIAKKRLAMMTTLKNNKRIAIKTIAVAILLAGSFFLFVEKTYAQVKKSNEKVVSSKPVKKDSTSEQVTIRPEDPTAILRGWGLNSNDTTPPQIAWTGKRHGNGVTQEQFDEYDKAVRGAYKMQTAPNGRTYFEVNPTGLDVKKLRDIYEQMTKEQQRKATKLIGYIPRHEAPAKISPTNEQLKQWQDPSYAGVWLDGKRIDNKELAKYKPSDFAHYFISRLYPNAMNYGKHKFQVDLSTPAYFEKSWPDGEAPPAKSVKLDESTIVIE